MTHAENQRKCQVERCASAATSFAKTAYGLVPAGVSSEMESRHARCARSLCVNTPGLRKPVSNRAEQISLGRYLGSIPKNLLSRFGQAASLIKGSGDGGLGQFFVGQAENLAQYKILVSAKLRRTLGH